MSALEIGLVATFGCAALWAVLDVLRKQLAGRIEPVGLTVWLAIGQAPFLLVWVLSTDTIAIAPEYWPWAIVTILFNIIGAVLYLVAVGSGHFSVAIPMLAFVPVWTTMLAIPMLQQVPSATQIAGIAAVVTGAIVLHGHGRLGLGYFTAMLREKASLAMLGVAVCWSATIVLDRRATAFAPLSVHALMLSIGIAAGAGLWLVWRGRVRDLAQATREPWRLLAAVMVAALAMAFQLRAMQDVDVAVLEAVKRTLGMGAAIALGRAVFGEPVTARKIGAVALMGAGTLLVLEALN